jgi:hypothetical protein
MRLKLSWVTAVAILAFTILPSIEAQAIVDNSQSPTAALCTGSCGVGSAIGVTRQVAQINDTDATGTSFSDIWTFSLSESGNIAGFLFANNTLNNFRLLDLNMILQSGDGSTTFDPISGYTVPNPPPVNMVLQAAVYFADLAAGDYRFVISGLVPGTHDAGQYQLQAVVSQVPLPAAAWLLLSALAGLAGMARVRGRAAGAA